MLVAHRENFVPRPEDGRPFWERMTLRERESLNPLGKPLPPKLAHRADPEIEVAQGNHKVEGAELGERLDDGSIEILHFPMRTYAQFENKIIKGGRAYARNRELPQRTGRTWRRLYETWEQGKLRDHYDDNVIVEGAGQRPGRGHAPAGLPARHAAPGVSIPASVGPRRGSRGRRRSVGRIGLGISSPTAPDQPQQAPAEGAVELPPQVLVLGVEPVDSFPGLVQAKHREPLRAGHQPHRVELHLVALALEL